MKKHRKKLHLRRESVRVLSDLELEDPRVAGGGSQIQTCSICKPPEGAYCCSDVLG